LPILDQDKRLVGIVSLGDIAVHAGDADLAGETLQEISAPSEPKR
jgi:CBS domain-containing protein